VAKVAFVFPGQGSQYVGMGAELADLDPGAARLFDAADELSGRPLKRLCLEGPLDELTLTVNLQPALCCVDLMAWMCLTATGVTPAAVAGHSLGEYPALAAAGVISPENAIKLAARRGALMDREATKNPGAMAAVVGLGADRVEEITKKAGGLVQPANFNAPTQTVITGTKDAVSAASALAKEAGGKAIPLKVSGAWHSPLMNGAKDEFAAELDAAGFSDPKIPLPTNVTARPAAGAADLLDVMKRQMVSPVRWYEIVEWMVGQGVDTFIEVGPKTVLRGLIGKCGVKGPVIILNVSDKASLEMTLQALGR
jgi:[acyl-carrier-protein] S-malonyltransferase